MAQDFYSPFSRGEAVELWSRLVAGWANSLNASGTRTLMDGIPNGADRGGSYEGVTRMLWGLGSWLSYAERPAQLEWRGIRYDLEQLTRRALVNGCDPAALGTWCLPPVRNKDGDQRTVESGQIGFVTWQTRERIWSRMNHRERGNVVSFLDQLGQRPSEWESNWSLFWVLNHTARKALGAAYDQSILDEVLGDYLDGVYCGDGWYDDADKCGAHHFDNYNSWVFAMHVLAWAQMDGASMPERRAILLERVRNWMQHYPYFFAEDGATVEYGRSLSYKFSRLGAPLWAYKLGVWPHSAGMLKRLVGRHLRWYVDHGAIRADGTLRQTLTVTGSDEVMERYISTGASYWAMQAFSGLWSLPDDDPFWSAEEEALPVEQGDFVKVFAQPGWVVTGRDGQVTQFNAGSGYAGAANKYMKLVYSTRNPFNVGLENGQPSLDSCLHLSEGGVRGQRQSEFEYALGDSGWIRTRYTILCGGHRHQVDTTLILAGDIHLRAHRIRLDAAANAGSVTAEEGSAAVGYDGYDSGTFQAVRAEDGWCFAEFGGNAVGIKPLRGYSSAGQALPGSQNSVSVYNLLTKLSAEVLKPQHDLICVIYAGDSSRTGEIPSIEHADWDANGDFVVQVNGQMICVPPVASSRE